MRYLCLIYENEKAWETMPQAESEAVMSEYFAFTGDIETDILSITAVHPMREEAVQTMLSRAGSSWEVVDRMLARGDLAETKYDGHVFYLRRFTEGRKAAT